jgi:MOSC domain-containing protein YiiM
MQTATVAAIYIARGGGAEMEQIPEARLLAGQGIMGDRYFRGTGTLSNKPTGDREVTLIEAEEIERFNRLHDLSLDAGSMRRNIITRGVRLNDLVGRKFQVGATVLHGIRLCEPCAHLAALVSPHVVKGMVHRAGLRAGIITGGMVQTGAPIILSPADV